MMTSNSNPKSSLLPSLLRGTCIVISSGPTVCPLANGGLGR